MEKVKSKIIGRLQENESIQFKNIETISGFVDEAGLLRVSIFIVSGYKGIDQENLNNLKKLKYFYFTRKFPKNKK